MPERVESTDPDGIDYGWVIQVTFVLSILVGAPVVGMLAVTTPLPTWNERLSFAIRVGAVVWLVVGSGVVAYAWSKQA